MSTNVSFGRPKPSAAICATCCTHQFRKRGRMHDLQSDAPWRSRVRQEEAETMSQWCMLYMYKGVWQEQHYHEPPVWPPSWSPRCSKRRPTGETPQGSRVRRSTPRTWCSAQRPQPNGTGVSVELARPHAVVKHATQHARRHAPRPECFHQPRYEKNTHTPVLNTLAPRDTLCSCEAYGMRPTLAQSHPHLW